ncbi:MAG: methyltransferase domain-containing protein [Candidatus Heimdallarchaeota archaeon]
MSIVYMKVLEAEPSKFDEAFQKLSPGVRQAYEHVLETMRAGKEKKLWRILEIGSGTGYLSRRIADEFDCLYTGIDISTEMVAYAKAAKSSEATTMQFFAADFIHMDLQELETQEFDLIISTFTLSELRIVEKRLFLQRIKKLFATDGLAIIADEITPRGLKRVVVGPKRFLYSQLALVKVGKTTYPLQQFPALLREEGLKTISDRKLAGSIHVWNVRKEDQALEPPIALLRAALGSFVGLKVAYCALNGVMTRKAIKPGIYAIGSPDKTSPVIVTANYYWTVARVAKRLLKKGVNLWVLVIDSSGINVWCAAGGGHFTAERVLNALRAFHVQNRLEKKTLILPQLCATGVDHQVLLKQGWKVHWGPVDIKDLPAYLENDLSAQADERLVKFPLGYRLIMGIQHAIFFTLYLLIGAFFSLFGSLFFYDQGMFWFNVFLTFILLSIVFSLMWSGVLLNFPLKSYFQNSVLFGAIAGLAAILWLLFETRDLNSETVIFWTLAIAVIALVNALDFAGHTHFTAVTQFEADLTTGGIFVVIFFLLMFLIGLTGQVEYISIV